MDDKKPNSIEKPLAELLGEWEDLVYKLNRDEIALYQWKEVYNVRADEIIAETDFKALYGANNQKVRDNHVKNELSEWNNIIKDLEFTINHSHNRISFLRELIRVKTAMIGASE